MTNTQIIKLAQAVYPTVSRKTKLIKRVAGVGSASYAIDIDKIGRVEFNTRTHANGLIADYHEGADVLVWWDEPAQARQSG